MFNTSIFDNGSGAPENTDSFLNVPQPIDITYQRQPLIFNNQRFRRESIAHSQGMGGVLWGSVTIGSWLKDEVMMYGAQNHHNQPQNHQHNIINPRRGLFRFQNVGNLYAQPLPNLVLMSPPNTTSYLPNLEADYCKDYLCCGQLLPTLHDLLRHYEEAHITLLPPHEPNTHMLNSHRNRNNMNNVHNVMETVLTNDVFLNNHHHTQAAQQGTLHLPASHFNIQLQTINLGPLAQTILPQLAINQPEQHSLHPIQAQPEGVMPQMANPQQAGSGRRGNADRKMDDGDSMYIDDPARHLYVVENEEYKPFRCPVIGCEKTYKNQNGLKYHRLHGHQNQKLKENDDGTFSIIDPESNTPYLDGAGMEKDKPYRCEVCGKRYKNLNGLKYHRGHTTH